MSREQIVRIQLVVLAVLTGLVVIRALSGPDRSERQERFVREMEEERDHAPHPARRPPHEVHPPAPPAPPRPSLPEAEVLVDLTRLPNDVQVEETFTLDERTRLHIYAVGEIDERARYDYGWIERAGNGRIVWEMGPENTEPAGGDERNRRFSGVVTLPSGRYVAHFRTDASYAYGDFDYEPPVDPRAWGISIRRLPD